MRRSLPLFFALAALVAIAACKPIQTDHTYDYDYPSTRQDFTVRWIGTPSGVALWVSTANDLEENGRYEGIQFLVDPGSPTDVESVVLPYLAKNGMPPGHPLAYVVLTSGDAQAMAGAERAAKEFKGARIIAPGRVSGAKGKPAPAVKVLEVGPEVSARLFRLDGAAAIDAQAVLLRFIDVAFLLLPAHTEGIADAMADSVGEKLEKEGLHTTLLYAAGGMPVSEHPLEHLDPEVVVGAGAIGSMLSIPVPKPGEVLQVGTNGSEMTTPGPRTRSRYGHWIDCSGVTSCGAELAVHGEGPVLVPITLAGQDEGVFLVDTRAPFSYLARPRFEKIPGWEKAAHGGHSHAGGEIGVEVPGFTLSGGGRSVKVLRWHALPIEPFQIDGKDVAGVLGMDILQSFRLELRPKEKVLAFTPNFDAPREHLEPAEKKTDGARQAWDVPMDRSPAGPLILATMDGEPRSLIVDLAAEQTRVYVRKDAWQKVESPKPQELWVFDVPDEIDEASWKKWELEAGALDVKELNLFGAKFEDTTALAIDRPLEADVIGLDFLRTFDRVSLDFRRRSIVLERTSG